MPDEFRIYVQQDGTIKTSCVECGAEQSITVDGTRPHGSLVEVKCSCGKSFSVLPEFRKAYRRKVSLSGNYTRLGSENEHGEIHVTNMSMTGLGFTRGDHYLSKADELDLRITFDDKNRTEFEAVAVIVHVHEKIVGCAFKEVSPDNEDRLASYLMLIP